MERSRNEVLNDEEFTVRKLDNIEREIAEKIRNMDQLEDKLKVSAEKTLSEGTLGQKMIEMITGGLHTHDERISQFQSNL